MAWSSSAHKQRVREIANATTNAQTVTTRCLHCTNGRRFKYTGKIREGQARLQLHRDVAHPELEPLEQARIRSSRKLRRMRTTQHAGTSNARRAPPWGDPYVAESAQSERTIRRSTSLPAIGR